MIPNSLSKRLADWRSAYAYYGVDALPSERFIQYAHELGDGPWEEHPLTPKMIANLLKKVGIKGHKSRSQDGSRGRSRGAYGSWLPSKMPLVDIFDL